jgi:hypothetical protein
VSDELYIISSVPKIYFDFFWLIGGFNSRITLILAMLTLIPCLHMMWPNNMPIGVEKMTFLIFKDK